MKYMKTATGMLEQISNFAAIAYLHFSKTSPSMATKMVTGPGQNIP